MVLAMAGAGALGAVARFLVERAVTARVGRRFPWGTWLVNVSGSLLLGFVTGLALYHGLDADARTVAGVGFLGGYTTFSTLTFEAIELPAPGGGGGRAVAYVTSSIAVGLLAATLGLIVAGA
jgi:CrcB protein